MLLKQLFESPTRVKERTLTEHLEDWTQNNESRSKSYWQFIFTNYRETLQESIPDKSIKAYRTKNVPETGIFENYSSWSTKKADGYWTLLGSDDIEAILESGEVIVKPGKYTVERYKT